MATTETIIARYRDEGVSRVKLAFTDIDGVHRGKYISLDKFESIAHGSAGMCDCVLGWDVDDQLYDNASFTGWHTAFPDAPYKIDLSTERRLPDEEGIPLFLVEFVDDAGDLHPICPRSVMKRVLRRAESMGFAAKLAFEYEFFVFSETPHTIREKDYKGLTPLTPGNFGYSVLRSSTESDLFNGLMDYCSAMDIAIEGLHCETGAGVWEAAIAVDNALAAADKAALFKTFSKVFFQRRDCVATFMAKWSMDFPGQSGHVHQSLSDAKSGDGLFHDASAADGMSALMRHYVAGQQAYLKPLLMMAAPTVNSYTRLVKGAWAPTTATWGVENRTAALRVIPGSPKSQRVEVRIGPADANPYLIAAATIGAGLLGIEQKLDLANPVVGNAYEQEAGLPESLQLATNLRDAIRDFSSSTIPAELFGSDFAEHFAASRDWEVREYERSVTDWQLRRYFEII